DTRHPDRQERGLRARDSCRPRARRSVRRGFQPAASAAISAVRPALVAPARGGTWRGDGRLGCALARGCWAALAPARRRAAGWLADPARRGRCRSLRDGGVGVLPALPQPSLGLPARRRAGVWLARRSDARDRLGAQLAPLVVGVAPTHGRRVP